MTDAVPADQVPEAAQPFFAVSVTKLIVLSLCTLGLYQVYWFYQNWKRIHAREDVAMLPLARAIFCIFYCYAAFRRIRDFRTQRGANTSLAAGELAAGWIIFTLLANIPEPYFLLSLLAVGFMAPVQATVQQINAEVAPTSDQNRHFTAINWATVFIGGIFLLMAIVGSFLGEP